MKLRNWILTLLAAVLLLSCGATASADPFTFNLRVFVGDSTATVRAMQNDYSGNYYISLSDLSAVLKGTPKAFTLKRQYTDIDGEFFAVYTGQDADSRSGAGYADETRWVSSFMLFRNRIFVDGQERRYYSFRDGNDVYMSLTDIVLMLGLQAEISEDGLHIDPYQDYRPDVELMAQQGYFCSFSAVLLADADTGIVIFEYNADDAVPIASITKLMTYLLLAEGADRGEISFNDQVTASGKAAALSQGADAMVSLEAGRAYPFQELLSAMLLASSNESALALAEHLDGSEEAFVAHMNTRARELGLSSARFFNPHGLPVYLPQAVTNKVQNTMSARDLFALCQLLLQEHPEILSITRESYGSMPSLRYTTANSNPIVFNLAGCNGLKTGSTNKAGSCLVATLPVSAGGETHTAVAIVLGAEGPDMRNQAAEILLRYARDTWQEQGFPRPEVVVEPSPDVSMGG